MAGWFLQRMKKEFLESRTVNVNAITIGGLINHFQFSGRWLDGIEKFGPLAFRSAFTAIVSGENEYACGSVVARSAIDKRANKSAVDEHA